MRPFGLVLGLVLAACGEAGPEEGAPGSGGTTPGGMSSGGLSSGGNSSGGLGAGGLASGGAPSGGAPAAGGAVLGGSGVGGEPVANVGGQSAGGSGGASSGGASSGGASSGGSMEAGGSGGGEATCPFTGHITYTLSRAMNPSADELAAYAKIEAAIERALSYYNCYTNITKALNVQFNPSVPTADGNPNGSIRFGSSASMNFVTAMHEISHTLGVGDDNGYDLLIEGGVYTGPIATARLRELTGDDEAEIHGDGQHFWPYGLNYESEWHSDQDGIFHCYIVQAIREDMGRT